MQSAETGAPGADFPSQRGRRLAQGHPAVPDRLERLRGSRTSPSRTPTSDWLGWAWSGYNARFGRQPSNGKDLHRPLTAADDLDEILAWREVRTVTHNLTLHYDRMMLLLDPTPFARGLARQKVNVVNYPDGRFAIQFEGTSLPFRVFDKIQKSRPRGGTAVSSA